MFHFLEILTGIRLHRDGDISEFGLFLAGELVVALILIAIAAGAA